MANVILKKLEKQYPNGFKAVHGIDLEILDGEFMVLVGPSGCAKSTTLRMIAGLESNTGGEIIIGDRNVDELLPKDRGISMVFQNYALYPHMTAYENMAFGLENTKVPKDEIQQRIADAAKKLQIEDLLDRKPKEMSGGQCQRIAVGRAIVRKPDVFLFDEPLSNLDAKLRVSMRVSLMELHRNLKAEGVSSTMVYVTHDQVEAMTMGDRICVLNKGEIMQVDTPVNLYHYPKSKFVAGFIGSPAMNMLKAKVVGEDIQLANGYTYSLPKSATLELNNGLDIWVGIRPEVLKVMRAVDDYHFSAEITNIERMGNEDLIHCESDSSHLIARVSSNLDEYPKIGEKVYLSFDCTLVHYFSTTTEDRIELFKVN